MYIILSNMISKKVIADIYVLGARVLNRIISKLYHTLIVTQKEVPFLELHYSLAKFAWCKEFVHNKHP